MNKQESLRLIQHDWQTLLALLSTLTDEQKLAPVLPGNWSVKDTVVHLSAWEGELSKWLSAANAGHDPGVPQFTMESTDQFNANVYHANRERPYTDVYANFLATHDGVLAQISSLPESIDDPRWQVWKKPDHVWLLIEGNTYGHYREHEDLIQKWLASQQP